VRLGEPDQVADRPSDAIARAFEKTVAPRACAEHSREVASYGRLFGEDDDHSAWLYPHASCGARSSALAGGVAGVARSRRGDVPSIGTSQWSRASFAAIAMRANRGLIHGGCGGRVPDSCEEVAARVVATLQPLAATVSGTP
jgi:hypothetical protein